MAKVETLYTRPSAVDWLLIILAGSAGYVQGAPWSSLLCAVGMGAALGVWRAVKFLAKLVEYRQAEYEAADEV